MAKKRLYLVRHCEPDMTKGIRYDVPPGPSLSDRGKLQAIELKEFFSNINVKKIYCSPFARTHETAKLGILSEGRELIIVEELREIRNDEAWENVKQRVKKWVNEVKERIEDNTCIVGHGATIEALLLAFDVDIKDAKRYKNDNILPHGAVWKIEIIDGLEYKGLEYDGLGSGNCEEKSLDGGIDGGLGSWNNMKVYSIGIVHEPRNFSE